MSTDWQTTDYRPLERQAPISFSLSRTCTGVLRGRTEDYHFILKKQLAGWPHPFVH